MRELRGGVEAWKRERGGVRAASCLGGSKGGRSWMEGGGWIRVFRGRWEEVLGGSNGFLCTTQCLVDSHKFLAFFLKLLAVNEFLAAEV